LENQLRQAQEEQLALMREVEKLKQEAQNAFATERMENAMMRERIGDVAAEVARLTSMLEGPGSTIDSMLASETPRVQAPPLHGNGHGSAGANGESGRGSLSDRIRALQNRAARTRPTAPV